jgi:protein tyrosine/serine phosphatase
MTGTLKQRLDAWQRRLTERIGTDISTPEARKAARRHYLLVDHGWLRALWRNFHRSAPGVYRSNQPSASQLRAVHARIGLKTVLNLRGASRHSFYLFEREVCADLGLTLVDLPQSARQPPTVAALEALVATFQTMERPVLIHCKSGADRTGLAAALYLLLIEGQPIDVAMRQLSFRYIHVARSAAGIQDHVLRVYQAAHRASGIGFMDWVRREYDPAGVAASFARWRAGDRSLT